MNRKIRFAMSKLSAAFTGLILCSNLSYAQERDRTILYRINTGGYQIQAYTAGEPVWQSDVTTSPTEYSNWDETDNNVYTTTEPVTLNNTVPEGTPASIFQFERVNGNPEVSSLRWTFPVEENTDVEIRLYFSEIFFDNAGSRIFDIKVNNELVYDNLDIYAEVGKYVGMMKTFETTSDGNIIIDLERVIQHPKINGIEIIGLGPEPEVTSLFKPVSNNARAQLFPNPANNNITIKTDEIDLNNCQFSIVDHAGNKFPASATSTQNGEATFNISDLENGLYYLMTISPTHTGGFKFIKQ